MERAQNGVGARDQEPGVPALDPGAPGPVDEEGANHPAFSLVPCGYQRDGVDRYLQDLRTNLDAARADLTALKDKTDKERAEDRKDGPSAHDLFDQVGDRVAEVLRTAAAQAEAMVSDAQAGVDQTRTAAWLDAEQVRDAARLDAGRTLVDAERTLAEARSNAGRESARAAKILEDAEAVRERARQEGERVLAQAQAQVERLAADIAAHERRLGVLRELSGTLNQGVGQLVEALQRVMAAIAAGPEPSAGPQPAGDHDRS